MTVPYRNEKERIIGVIFFSIILYIWLAFHFWIFFDGLFYYFYLI